MLIFVFSPLKSTEAWASQAIIVSGINDPMLKPGAASNNSVRYNAILDTSISPTLSENLSHLASQTFLLQNIKCNYKCNST